MASPDHPELVFIERHEKADTYTHCGILRFSIAQWDATDGPKSWAATRSSTGIEASFDSLVVDAQYNTDGDQPFCPYGFSVEYQQPFGVALGRARVMVNTLSSVERSITRLQNQFGPPPDFATYVIWAGRALGVTHIARRKDGRYWFQVPLTSAAHLVSDALAAERS